MDDSTTPITKVTRIPAVDPEVVRNRDLPLKMLRPGKSTVQKQSSGVGMGWDVPPHILRTANTLIAQRTESAYRRKYRRAFGSLSTSEVVHHLDGDRANNDIANLCSLTKSQHASLHWKIRSGQEVYGDATAIGRIRGE